MTCRICPWCGKNNLRIENVMGANETIYWHDSACGYREQTNYEPFDIVKKITEPIPRKYGQMVLGCDK